MKSSDGTRRWSAQVWSCWLRHGLHFLAVLGPAGLAVLAFLLLSWPAGATEAEAGKPEEPDLWKALGIDGPAKARSLSVDKIMVNMSRGKEWYLHCEVRGCEPLAIPASTTVGVSYDLEMGRHGKARAVSAGIDAAGLPMERFLPVWSALVREFGRPLYILPVEGSPSLAALRERGGSAKWERKAWIARAIFVVQRDEEGKPKEFHISCTIEVPEGDNRSEEASDTDGGG